MMKPEQIVEEFSKNATDFFSTTSIQRKELYQAYAYRDSHQWSQQQIEDRQRVNKKITVINLAAPLIRAVSGSEIMQDKKIEYVSTDPNYDSQADVMNDAAEYCQYISGYKSEQSLAREDAATCGIGATVTYLDMTKKNAIAGVPIVERIFPGFMGYDSSSRGSRINEKARWCFYADPVAVDTLTDYVREKVGDNPKAVGAGDYKAYLMSFNQQENAFNIDFIYHYFWWEYTDLYDVANPFLNARNRIGQHILEDEDVANIIGDIAAELSIDWESSYWTLDKEGYDKLNNAIESVSLLVDIPFIKPEYSKRKGKCYYRAEIARGYLLSAGRSYTQGGHMLNFITGYFDEIMGVYYGLMRPISYIQDALNISTSDFLGYANSAAHGGSAYVKGAGEALERLKKSKAYEDDLTPIPADAEIIPKSLPATPQVLVEFIRLMMEVMPRAVGLGQEFLGVITSGDMTDSLYGKVMKQSYAVLANFANNSANYSRRQGDIFADITRLMADANDGMVLPIMSPESVKDGKTFFRLTRQNLASEYVIRVVERPITLDERQETFNMLSQVAPQLIQAGADPMAISRMLMKASNLPHTEKQEIEDILTPKPQQPDPRNEAMIDSQIRLSNAQAMDLETKAAERQSTLQQLPDEKQSVIDKNNAQAISYLDKSDNSGNSGNVKLSEIDRMISQERIAMAKIESQERIAKMKAEPKTQIMFSADDALSKIADHLEDVTESLSQATDKLHETANKTQRATEDHGRMLSKASESMDKAARYITAPKRIVTHNGKPDGRPIGVEVVTD